MPPWWGQGGHSKPVSNELESYQVGGLVAKQNEFLIGLKPPSSICTCSTWARHAICSAFVCWCLSHCGLSLKSWISSVSCGGHPSRKLAGDNVFNVFFISPFILSIRPSAVGLYGRCKVHNISQASAHSWPLWQGKCVPWSLSIWVGVRMCRPVLLILL